MRSTVETITPKKAQQWLANNARNRPLSMTWAERLAEVIKRGEFQLNGDAVRFNCDGGLVDGQHRLQAVIISGRPIQSLVVRGVEEKAFDTIDQGKKRSIGDMLAREGEKHYVILATACKFVWCYEHRGMTGVDGGRIRELFTPTIAQQVLAAHPGLRSSADFISPHKNDLNVSAGMAVAIHYFASKTDSEKADEFFTKLATGENINRNDAVYVVRQRLIKNRNDQSKLRQHVLAAFVVKGWNAYIRGQRIGTLKWTDNENFPEIA